jgi:hypothetical protein
MSLERFAFRGDPLAFVTLDARHVYQSRSYSDALTSLHQGILAGHGILILLAKSGMGKTTLLQDLRHRLEELRKPSFFRSWITSSASYCAVCWPVSELMPMIATSPGCEAA